MDGKQKPTAGPFDLRSVMGEEDIEVYSTATGKCIASVHAKDWRHKDGARGIDRLAKRHLLDSCAAPALLDGRVAQQPKGETLAGKRCGPALAARGNRRRT